MDKNTTWNLAHNFVAIKWIEQDVSLPNLFALGWLSMAGIFIPLKLKAVNI